MCFSVLRGVGVPIGRWKGCNYCFEGDRRGRGVALSTGQRHGGEFFGEESQFGWALEPADRCVLQKLEGPGEKPLF